jgi:predicted RNase H-like HicB family nuclease
MEVTCMSLKFTVSLQNEGEWIVATCLENGIASQGHTFDDALSNLREALELYFEDNTSVPDYSRVYVTALEVAV